MEIRIKRIINKITMEITIFYEVDEKLQEKRKIEHLISLYNVQELFIEDENLNMINFHKASIGTLKFAIAAAQGHIKTDLNDVFIKLLNIRLNRLIEIQEESAKRLRKLYENGELKWMDDPFNKLISEMNIGLLNNNLTRLREGYYTAECGNLDSVWIKILEKELKTKEQAKEMESKMWPSSDGPIHVEKMSGIHINNCIQRLENKTKKGSFEHRWLVIFYTELTRRRSIEETIRLQEAQKRQEIIRREEEKQRKIAFAAKVWKAYKNRDLIVEIYGDEDAIVQDLSVKQLNYGIKEFEDDTMIAILRKELETRNSACLDNYDNDKLFLYGRNVSYMNLTNVSDGINAIKKNPEHYLESLLECMKHRRKAILFNRHEYEAIKADLVDLFSYGLERLEELYEGLKGSNDPIERKLCGLYAKAIKVAKEKEEERLLEEGRQILIAYKSNDLSYAYKDENDNFIIAFVHEMPLSHLRAGLLYTSEGGYNAQWPAIFKMEIGKREEEIRQIIKSISYASAYGTTGTLLSEYCVCILNLSLLGNFNRI